MAYFDNNSTTRPFPEVLDAVRSASDSSWANPSSPHRAGSQVRVRLEQAREEFGHSLGVDPARLTFTSGATESNNAVLGWLANRKSPFRWDGFGFYNRTSECFGNGPSSLC